jgi:hypothetical protein
MDQEFEKRIIEDLEKSGFSSELRAIRTFMSNGWGCTGLASYIDLDKDLVTGVDLIAWKDNFVRLKNLRYGVQFNINAEVKKSEKPWVIFKEMSAHVTDDYLNNLIYMCGLTPYHFRQSMSADSVYTRLEWRGHGIHESFKEPDVPSRSYPAFVNVCKSSETRLDACTAYYKEREQYAEKSNNPDPYKERVVILVKPIVILDGTLIAAGVSDAGEVLIEEIKFAPLEFHYKSKHCVKGHYLVDVVTLEALQEYIEMSEKRLRAIFDCVEAISGKDSSEGI